MLSVTLSRLVVNIHSKESAYVDGVYMTPLSPLALRTPETGRVFDCLLSESRLEARVG